MAKTAPKNKLGSTQKFTEIKDISEDIIIFENGRACLIIEIKASNFALLSKQEQDAKIYSYASLLNSLSFPVQVVIRNKKIDITSYLNFLDQESQKVMSMQSTQATGEVKPGMLSEGITSYIRLYKEFIQELVTVNSVLDKKFYMIISYSYLEKGVSGAAGATRKGTSQDEVFLSSARETLHTKSSSLLSQIARLGLQAKTLQQDELIKIFYDIYNQEQTVSNDISSGIRAPIIKGGKV